MSSGIGVELQERILVGEVDDEFACSYYRVIELVDGLLGATGIKKFNQVFLPSSVSPSFAVLTRPCFISCIRITSPNVPMSF